MTFEQSINVLLFLLLSIVCQKYVMSLIEHVYNDVQFNDPPEADLLTGLKRVDVVTTACHFGHDDCVEKCRRNFAAWMLESNPEFNNPYVVLRAQFILLPTG